MTFSIIGFDPVTKELGIAVQSKFLAVGSVVPWAKSGVGAIATQSYANPSYGPEGLKLMEEGKSAQETLDILIENDKGSPLRQVGIMDGKGNAAIFTGEDCHDWAGGRVGLHCVAQGNILVGEATVDALIDTFEEETGTLSERLLAALDAGQAAGGDRRGMQSAAIYVVKEKGGYLQANDRYVDLRVDEHVNPIKELKRIYNIHLLYSEGPKNEKILKIEGEVRQKLVNILYRLGLLAKKDKTDDALYNALSTFIHTENLRRRELNRGKIDKDVLQFMDEKSSFKYNNLT